MQLLLQIERTLLEDRGQLGDRVRTEDEDSL